MEKHLTELFPNITYLERKGFPDVWEWLDQAIHHQILSDLPDVMLKSPRFGNYEFSEDPKVISWEDFYSLEKFEVKYDGEDITEVSCFVDGDYMVLKFHMFPREERWVSIDFNLRGLEFTRKNKYAVRADFPSGEATMSCTEFFEDEWSEPTSISERDLRLLLGMVLNSPYEMMSDGTTQCILDLVFESGYLDEMECFWRRKALGLSKESAPTEEDEED